MVSDPILPLISPLPVTSEVVGDHILPLVPEVPAPTSGPPKIKVPEAFKSVDFRQKVKNIEDMLAVAKALSEEKKLEEAFEAYGVAVGMVKKAMKTSSLPKLPSLLHQAIIDGGGLLYHIAVPHDVFERKVKIRGFQPTFSKFCSSFHRSEA